MSVHCQSSYAHAVMSRATLSAPHNLCLCSQYLWLYCSFRVSQTFKARLQGSETHPPAIVPMSRNWARNRGSGPVLLLLLGWAGSASLATTTACGNHTDRKRNYLDVVMKCKESLEVQCAAWNWTWPGLRFTHSVQAQAPLQRKPKTLNLGILPMCELVDRAKHQSAKFQAHKPLPPMISICQPMTGPILHPICPAYACEDLHLVPKLWASRAGQDLAGQRCGCGNHFPIQ